MIKKIIIALFFAFVFGLFGSWLGALFDWEITLLTRVFSIIGFIAALLIVKSFSNFLKEIGFVSMEVGNDSVIKSILRNKHRKF